MCDLRAAVHDASLDRTGASKIRKRYATMLALDDDLLLHLSGPYRAELVTKFPHLLELL
jgi:hypothetical protein